MDMMRWTFPYPDQCTSELQDKQIDIIQDKKIQNRQNARRISSFTRKLFPTKYCEVIL